jgi:uncharacterized protein YciI
MNNRERTDSSATEPHIYLVLSSAGPNRDLSKDSSGQQHWDEHVPFINGLIDAGFIMMGGPLDDEGGALLIVRATDEAEVRARMKDDPFYRHGILHLEWIKRWTIYIDERT